MSLSPQEDATADAASRLKPISLDGIEEQVACSFLRQMMLIRSFERAAESLLQKGAFPGGMHSAIGQEATAVGVLEALDESDIIGATHRSHHITLAKKVSARSVMAELFGKATGCVGGRGGHMHLADVQHGHFGANGVVGGGLGLALGAALAASVQKRPQVAVGFFGDGGANLGRVWEFVNLAALWGLPLVIVCENNLYAVETPLAAATAGGDISRRAGGFGLPVETVDGQDVAEIYRVTTTAVVRARAGGGPTFIESLTYRYGGHDVGDRVTYRTKDEVDDWRSHRDPVGRLIQALTTAELIDDARVQALDAEVDQEVADAIDYAEKSPFQDAATFSDGVTGIDMRIRTAL